MAWPTTPIVADQEGTAYDTLVLHPFGADATSSYDAAYDEGYADGVAAGGGGGVPTEGQIWPRRG